MTPGSFNRQSLRGHHVYSLVDRTRSLDLICATRPGVAHGMGSSYGDVCLNPGGVLWKTTGLDRFIDFDENTGDLTCEAGVLLQDIQRLAIPRGWMLPVSPGTQLVTVGGAIANDVHGKNQHGFGSFGDHLSGITLLRTDGESFDCGPQAQKDWFSATIGGVGLTGVILAAQIKLRRILGPWLETETIPFHGLDEFFLLAENSRIGWEYTVAWMDTVRGRGGRGLFMRGNHSEAEKFFSLNSRRWAIPYTPPVSLVNKLSIPIFNSIYFALKKQFSSKRTIHYEPFFYPLDNLLGWKNLYGNKGLYQYQCVLPWLHANEAARAIMQEVNSSKETSALAVIKTFGNLEPVGMLSFAKPGVTLALDFPNRGEPTLSLFKRLDAVVRSVNGRLYLAKDVRMPRDLFEMGYPNLKEFLTYRDPGISSGLSRRLMGF